MDQDTLHQFADAMEILSIPRKDSNVRQELRNAARQLRLLLAGMTEHMDRDYLTAMEHRPAIRLAFSKREAQEAQNKERINA